MPTLVVLLLVVAIHLATNATAWGSVGLLADDRFNVGFQVLLEKLPLLEQLRLIFVPDKLAVDQTAALYRPFISLTFLLEYPWFGAEAMGYHITNSALHCGTAMLWFGLVRRMSGSLVAATATAVAFAGWPGHSEVTHWISARTNLQSTFFMALALYLWDRAELCRSRKADTTLSLLAIAAGVLALGSKETAVLVGPLALVVTWLRGAGLPIRSRLVRSMLRTLPLAAGLLAWLWLRSTVLQTWGAGSGYSWPLEESGFGDKALTVLAWLASWVGLLMAPCHHEFTAGFLVPALWLLHGGLIVLALRGKEPGRRQTRWLAAAILGLGLLAISGLPKNSVSLENIRYTYEPALGLCTLLGLGIAALPFAARGPALGLLVVVHAMALDGNREPWLRAGALHSRMEQQAYALAREADSPIWLIDAPAVYDGAFVYLVENPTVFLPPFSPVDVAGKGRVSTIKDYQALLMELATRARANQPVAHAYRVGWADGRLRPFALDTSFPKRPWPDVTLGYAMTGRDRPYLGGDLPVYALVENGREATLTVRGTAGARSWTGPPLQLPRSDRARIGELTLPLPADLPADELVTIELEYAERRGRHTYPVAQVRPAARSTRP